MENRLKYLETKVIEDVGKTMDIVDDLKSEVESFKRKLENVEHLSWMGLFKEKLQQTSSHSQPAMREEQAHVRRTFHHMSSLHVNEEVREYLKTPLFDNWQWEEAEMMVLLQVMYTDLDFLAAFHIDPEVLQNFLFEVYCHYNNIPFHNFQHWLLGVTQM
ncbi:hypothetical protein CRUP_027007, partial [Coryphaenoides rupestris]